nr:immunoglobulin light chain junction region [Macaca mulatta]MOW15071.1 immunoglobulin light chain junction region [Macaca mulatta]MOW15326.1 immunoglobulin light chain junction region [Macaca mulatta]MOW15328.1 immunoglobulin light chain junction region [Macaca mulatta]MOW15528.1 immunoglobulin light chain junction region [Macaca mulatta]
DYYCQTWTTGTYIF